MANTTDKTRLYKLSIHELRRMHDEICNNYNRVQGKIVTFIGGALALLAFLYGSDSNNHLFFPKELYGQILYCLALLLYFIALAILFGAVRPVVWEIPTESKRHKEFNSYPKFLDYVRKEYVKVVANNIAHSDGKHQKLNLASLLLVIGGIVLLIIKKFS